MLKTINSKIFSLGLEIAEGDLLPTRLLRQAVRQTIQLRHRELNREGVEGRQRRLDEMLRAMEHGPIARNTEASKSQHYEVPTEFYQHVLGRHLKYSCAHWPKGIEDLDAAEQSMLELYLQRARLKDGQKVLELGCGWGSLSLFLAKRFPGSSITAVSHSRTQREFIRSAARRAKLSNLRILTRDMNDFRSRDQFDRVLSIEMIEHMWNWGELLDRVSRWLKPDGLLFLHFFCHRDAPYPFLDEGSGDWMARNFFSGGIMPSLDLPLFFQDRFRVGERWVLPGTHYQKTARAWLRNLEERKKEILTLFSQTYGPDEAKRRWAQWKIFFIACEELWAFRDGQEWLVAHYLLEKRV